MNMHPRFRSILGISLFAIVFGTTLAISQQHAGDQQPLSPARDFVPDGGFAARDISEWKRMGDATWTAQGDEIVGSAQANGKGGWLVLPKVMQDVQFFTRFACNAPCDAGVMLRAESLPDGGVRGYWVHVADDDYTPYLVELRSDGTEVSRSLLRRGPVQLRFAPPKGTPPSFDVPVIPGIPPPSAQPRSTGAAAPRPPVNQDVKGKAGEGGGPNPPANVTLPELMPPPPDLQHGPWNELQLIIDANVIHPNLNWGNQIGAVATEDDSLSSGPFLLYVGPGTIVRYKDVVYKDLNHRVIPAEVVSPRFRMQRLENFYYGWDVGVGDFNHDGVLDVEQGPFIYLGPDYRHRQEIYLGQTINPSVQYPPDMITFGFDFTGDGWDDILATEYRQMVLYVNPHGADRRWERHLVVPGITSELTVLKDLDGDGRPELVFARSGTVMFAKYDPQNPTAEWKTYQVSDPGLVTVHGLGVGDINGDGRPDILAATGWWEQPAAGATSGLWHYHPQAFARWSRSEQAGGGLMSVWDVNGDGLADVVTSLNAHGWGLAWFEQKRAGSGEISFVRHMIMDDFSTKNAGGLTFSELHSGVIPVDIDGDGVMDFVTGKRSWAHRESYTDPDPNGPAYLVWYRGVRNSKAPGGAEFVPEVIHNFSGVGSGFTVADLNKDGIPDVITATSRGTYIFFGTRGRRAEHGR